MSGDFIPATYHFSVISHYASLLWSRTAVFAYYAAFYYEERGVDNRSLLVALSVLLKLSTRFIIARQVSQCLPQNDKH